MMMKDQPGQPGQLGLAGMPRRLYVCTPTRLLTWADCPRRYRFVYLTRPSPAKGPPWAHTSLGAAVHTALAAWWRLPVGERTPRRAGDDVEEAWSHEGFRDEAHSAAYRGSARRMVERYVARLDPRDEPVGVERTVAMRTPTLALSGRVDRIDARVGADGEELVVVDYKAGRREPEPEEARGSLALAVYALAAARALRRVCRRVELHHLPSGRVVAHEHTPESLARHERRVEAIAAEASAAGGEVAAAQAAADPLPPERLDELFPPRPGTACGWCDYLRHCPQGRAAAVPRLPWAGLGELEPP